MSHIPLLGEKIKISQNILLINHIRMDPDAHGSLSGFYQTLKALGKDVCAINDQEAPENFSFMGYNDIYQTQITFKNNNDPDLIISFDASSLDQLGEMYKNNESIFNGVDFFVIDHHITNPGFGQYNIIKTHYSSTCEITTEIIEELGYSDKITAKIATCLFSGIITDTNIFYNKNTSSNTHIVSAKLMKYGADFRAPIYEFYQKQTLESLQFNAVLISKIQEEKINNTTIHYILVELEDFDNAGIPYEFGSLYTKNFIGSTLANIDGSNVCFILYPLRDGTVKASFRSKEIDVSKICQKYGGGGHKLAAGCSSELDINEFKNEILKNF